MTVVGNSAKEFQVKKSARKGRGQHFGLGVVCWHVRGRGREGKLSRGSWERFAGVHLKKLSVRFLIKNR